MLYTIPVLRLCIYSIPWMLYNIQKCYIAPPVMPDVAGPGGGPQVTFVLTQPGRRRPCISLARQVRALSGLGWTGADLVMTDTAGPARKSAYDSARPVPALFWLDRADALYLLGRASRFPALYWLRACMLGAPVACEIAAAQRAAIAKLLFIPGVNLTYSCT